MQPQTEIKSRKEEEKISAEKKKKQKHRANISDTKAAKKIKVLLRHRQSATCSGVACRSSCRYVQHRAHPSALQTKTKMRLKNASDKASIGGGQMQSALSVRGQLTYCMTAQSLLPCRPLFPHTQTNKRTDSQAGRQLVSKVLKDAGTSSIQYVCVCVYVLCVFVFMSYISVYSLYAEICFPSKDVHLYGDARKN